MRRAAAFSLLVLVSAAAAAATPQVTAVAPTSASASGGTTVHVSGSGLTGLPLLCPAPVCSNYVQFGDVLVFSQPNSSDSDLIVIAPPHAPGVVDLIVHIAGYPSILLPGAFRYDNADSGWVRVLLPVLAQQLPGANGSLWSTEVFFSARQPVDIVAVCPGLLISPCPSSFHVDPSGDVPMPAAFIPHYPGSGFIHILAAAASDVAINLRVRDTSRSATDLGTEVPAVRDRDFRHHVSLVGVPTDSRFRLTLRIYSLGGLDSQATLRLVSEKTNATVVGAIVPLVSFDPTNTMPVAAASAQIALDTVYPLIVTGDPIRVDVDSEPTAQPIWAFVSITNNDTQHVTLVTPW
jgi:hypothetical protein